MSREENTTLDANGEVKEWAKPICNADGTINYELLRGQMENLQFLHNNVGLVYEEYSGLSKPYSYAKGVIDHGRMKQDELYGDMHYDDISAMAEDGQVSLEDIKEYFKK